ncbi:uncharacterized protein LOC108481064 [Gossypium arboreum]|uniref:uncharacterized protein LOC108481064 n=1 Tax=Gossypium arboreum TaxID=29729 RepID=UPI00081936C1|nr:uncharacterized protein LOC108481064 [Gossypium arboreum]
MGSTGAVCEEEGQYDDDVYLKSMVEVHNFLGLTGYYRRFVEGFSLIEALLTKLLRRWKDAQQESFEKLKTVVTQALVLIQPESGKDFVVYSDASHKELNLRQHRWVELLKNYDWVIEYHPGKANMVADALSHRVMTDLRAMFTRLSLYEDGSLLAELQVKPMWLDQIKDTQLGDKSLELQFRQVEACTTTDFRIDSNGVLRF